MLLCIWAPGSKSFAQDTTTSTSRLILIGAPDSTVISANDTEINHDFGGWYDVPAGDVKIKIYLADTLVFSSNMKFQKGLDHRLIFGCRADCNGGRLQIASEPKGALVSIDGEPYGYTPLLNNLINPGNHTIQLTMDGYAPLTHTFLLIQDNADDFYLTLERSQEHKDSVGLISVKKKRVRRGVQKFFLSVITIALAGAGGYYDLEAKSYLSLSNDASAAYDAAHDNFDVHRATYYQNRDRAKKMLKYRNILCGSAGVSLLAFGFSFVF
jgi:hypothetical protein